LGVTRVVQAQSAREYHIVPIGKRAQVPAIAVKETLHVVPIRLGLANGDPAEIQAVSFIPCDPQTMRVESGTAADIQDT
jgi:hypothetical protein